jgi:hypothetical protein
MNTKDHVVTMERALDLALEALGQLGLFGDEAAVIANPAITAIKQARSAPYVASPRVQDTEAHYKGVIEGVQKLFNDKRAQPAPVQEQAAFNAGVPLLYPEMKDGETISVEYTTQPAAPVQEPAIKQGWDVDTLLDKPAAPVREPDYAWPAIADYEKEVGFAVNDTFKAAWQMARATNDLFTRMGNVT